jgi:hypothetical protein
MERLHPQRILYVEQGRKNKMHTLWVDYINGSEYVKARFIKNLSTDSEKAIAKALEYAKRIGVPEHFVYDHTHDLSAIKRVYKWTDTMVRFGKNYGMELRDCEPKFVHWVAKGCPLKNEQDGEWDNHYFGGQDFQAIAQSIAVEMGLGLMDDRIYHTPRYVTHEQYAKTTERLAQKASEQNGHFFENGSRVELTLTCKHQTSYDSNFGWIQVYKFIDSENRIFTYKGSNRLTKSVAWTEIHDGKTYSGFDTESLSAGDTITLMATIKHDNYRDVDSTYIQRIKIK